MLSLLPPVGLFTPCLPWHCQLDGNELLPCLGPQYNVWSKGCLDNIWEKTNLFPNSTSMFQPVVPPRIDDPTLRFCNVGFAVDEPTLRFCNVGCAVCVFLVSPDLTKAICPCCGLLPHFLFRSFSSQSANSLRTESCLHRYFPCVSAVGRMTEHALGCLVCHTDCFKYPL